MPLFPEVSEPLPLGGGDLPARIDQASALVPVERRGPATVVQDELISAEVAMWREHERQSEQAAGQCSTLTATGRWLESLGAERGVFRQEGEGQEVYRDRIFQRPDLVSPRAILDAVEAIIAPYTTILPQFTETILDGLFIEEDGSAEWSSHVFARGATGRTPVYLDRLYPDDASANGGHVRTQYQPDGAQVGDGGGRAFLLRIPEFGVIPEATYVTNTNDPLFIEDGDATWSSSIYSLSDSANAVYAAIINTVERITAHGIRWSMIVDPHLT